MVLVSRNNTEAATSAPLLSSKFIFLFALCGMVSFGTISLFAPRFFHGLASAKPFPEDDPSYYYHFAIREFMMGCMFGTAGLSYETLPRVFVKRLHFCHVFFVGVHLIMNNTVFQFSPSFNVFMNCFQAPLLIFSSYLYLKG